MNSLRPWVFALLFLATPKAVLAQEQCYQSLIIFKESGSSRQFDRYSNIQERLSEAKEKTLRVSAGRQIRWLHLPARDSAPTFLLLPGVNRGIVLADPIVAELAVRGMGVASFDFSVQPLSIQTLRDGERFLNKKELKNFDLKELSNEVELVREQLAKEGATTVIPVSLSFSGALSPLLRGQELIIDIVPMTSWAATNSALASIYQNLKLAEMFNPIFGPAITRATMDTTYRSKWQEQVEGITQQFALNPDRKNEMLEGYLALSRAVEGLEWNTRAMESTPRIFILAANESRELMRDQLEIFKELIDQGARSKLVVVEESGHIIPSEYPAVVAGLLQASSQLLQTEPKQVLVVNPITREFRSVPLDQLLGE